MEKFVHTGTKELPCQCRICRKYALSRQQEIRRNESKTERDGKETGGIGEKIDSSNRTKNEVKVEENIGDLEQVMANVECALEWEGDFEDIKENCV